MTEHEKTSPWHYPKSSWWDSGDVALEFLEFKQVAWICISCNVIIQPKKKKNPDPNNSNQNVCPPNVYIKLKQITLRYKLAIIIIVSRLLNEVSVIFLHIMLLTKLLRVIHYRFTLQSTSKQWKTANVFVTRLAYWPSTSWPWSLFKTSAITNLTTKVTF